jgi:hypothetical protein
MFLKTTAITGYKCDILHKEVDEKDVYILDKDGTVVSKEALEIIPRFLHQSWDLLLSMARWLNDEKTPRKLNKGIWVIAPNGNTYQEKTLKEAAAMCFRHGLSYVFKDGELFKIIHSQNDSEIYCNGVFYGRWASCDSPTWLRHDLGFSRIGLALLDKPMPNIGIGQKHIVQIQWRDEHGFVTGNRFYEAGCSNFSIKEDL